jgi:hypothetical protein
MVTESYLFSMRLNMDTHAGVCDSNALDVFTTWAHMGACRR